MAPLNEATGMWRTSIFVRRELRSIFLEEKVWNGIQKLAPVYADPHRASWQFPGAVVVTNGVIYNCAALWRSVGFKP